MSETIKDQETSSEQGNAGRRRLVRGAMALAPLVLTLRSGAAIASCTGVKAFVRADNGTGNIGNPSNVAVDDVCVIDYSSLNCNSEVKISGGTKVGNVTISQTGNGNELTCGSEAKNKQVAILSATSAGSLFGSG